MSKRNISTVKRFVEKYPDAYSEPSVRYKIFNAKTNGLEAAGAIIRDGSRVLIDEDRWFAALDAQQTHTAHR